MDMYQPTFKKYTVSTLLNRAKDLLSDSLPIVFVDGEFGGISIGKSGHMYGYLIEDKNKINIFCLKEDFDHMNSIPEDGMRALCCGKISIYSSDSSLQLHLMDFYVTGQGQYSERLSKLKKKLTAEGLFDSSRKKSILCAYKSIGIVASLEGAALQDVLSRIQMRFPPENILISPSSTQGEEAPVDLIIALKRFDKLPEEDKPDLVLIIRGGGSASDLDAYNNEDLVRTIASCSLPIVSGIGHETDFSLVDMSADLRASTPTAAAVEATNDRQSLIEIIDKKSIIILSCVNKSIDCIEKHLSDLTYKINHTFRVLEKKNEQIYKLQQILKISEERLCSSISRAEYILRMFRVYDSIFSYAYERLLKIEDLIKNSAEKKMTICQYKMQYKYATIIELFYKILILSYSNLYDLDDNRIHSIAQIKFGQPIKARLADGETILKVIKKK